jgi:arylsulfatase
MKKPNIVLIMVDQMRYDCAGFAGHPVAKSPVLDRMAQQGVRFENTYCASPLCSPARASWLTGLYPHGHLQLRNYGWKMKDAPGCRLPDDAVTIGDILNGAGYRCGMVGNWHLGFDETPQHGFNDMWLTQRYHRSVDTEQYEIYLKEHGLLETFWLDGKMKFKHTLKKGKLPVAATKVPTEHQRTTWAVDRGIEFIERKSEAPFFLFLSIKDPHPPLTPPEEFIPMFPPEEMPVYPSWDDALENKPEHVRQGHFSHAKEIGYEGIQKITAYYLALIAHVDNQIDRVFTALEKAGLDEDTLVVFHSDHGELLGEHGMFEKTFMYEGSVRVPLLMRWSGHVPENVTLTEPLAGVDLLSTMMDLAGVPLTSPIHGRSVADAVREGKEPQPCDVLSEIPTHEGIFDGIHDVDEEQLGATMMIRRGDWKLIHHREYDDELYDLKNDPGEMNNLAGDPAQADRVKELRNGIKDLDSHKFTSGSFS